MSLRNCSLCGSKVRLAQVNFEEAIFMCENIKCTYPFHPNEPTCQIDFVKRNFIEIVKRDPSNPLDADLDVNSIPGCENSDFLDNFFSCQNSVAETDYDIQAVDSIFEELQSFESQI